MSLKVDALHSGVVNSSAYIASSFASKLMIGFFGIISVPAIPSVLITAGIATLVGAYVYKKADSLYSSIESLLGNNVHDLIGKHKLEDNSRIHLY